MNARLFLLVALFFIPLPVLAQGFAGLGTKADGFALPQRGQLLEFPKDHGAHPEYRIEWWYLTATLQGKDGQDYGVQWTLFRSALAPDDASGWASSQIWMGHAALTSAETHFVAERLARGGIGQAGVTIQPFSAWIDNWEMTSETTEIDDLTLKASGRDFAYDLTLEATGPIVLHGDRGYSVKSQSGQASYYYSQPAYQVAGTLSLPNRDIEVTGQGWLDREWSSQPLAEDQTGWDWFSLSFDNGARLMGFVLRDSGAGFTSGTWISPDGAATALTPGAFQATPLEISNIEGRQVPTSWQVRLSAQNLEVTVQALNPQSWMEMSFPYWEGPVRVTGSHSGRGYLEMTGYK
jgi:predicted secreted hydrolase